MEMCIHIHIHSAWYWIASRSSNKIRNTSVVIIFISIVVCIFREMNNENDDKMVSFHTELNSPESVNRHVVKHSFGFSFILPASPPLFAARGWWFVAATSIIWYCRMINKLIRVQNNILLSLHAIIIFRISSLQVFVRACVRAQIHFIRWHI